MALLQDQRKVVTCTLFSWFLILFFFLSSDYASRGQKKFGDKCDNTLECGFPGSICDTKKKSCQCTEDLPVTNHFDKCGKGKSTQGSIHLIHPLTFLSSIASLEAAVNESCFFNEQCEVKYFQTECRDGRCVCRFDMTPIWLKDGSVECKGKQFAEFSSMRNGQECPHLSQHSISYADDR